MVCAAKGYPLVVTMAESFSVERRKLMRFLGAKVVLTPAAERANGMVRKAEELAAANGWFLTRQFTNEANPEIHARTTAREIIRDFDGERLDYWVTGYGTGGTLKGVGRVLRKERPQTKVVVCEPDNSQVLGSRIPQARAADGSPAGSHPNFRPHLMQGWSPDFIPKLTEDAVTMELVDQIMPINGNDALKMSRELAQKEGIFVGITAGATFAGALKICESAPPGTKVLCMLPDTGERYLTTPLFADIPADMTEEEVSISKSTPNYRFDVAAAPAPAPAPAAASAPAPQPVAADAEAYVKKVLSDPAQPVVMFALEWCEFCWAVRKMFGRYRIPYRSVDLDSVEYQKDNLGGKIRAALTARTSVATIPQIFIGGEFIGGSTDLFNAWKQGRVQGLLANARVEYDKSVSADPYSFLPTWLHPR
jgi:cysteine synthase A